MINPKFKIYRVINNVLMTLLCLKLFTMYGLAEEINNQDHGKNYPNGIHPANKAFVESQMKRVHEMQSRIDELKKNRVKELTKSKSAIDEKVYALLTKLSPEDNAKLREKKSIEANLKSEIAQLTMEAKGKNHNAFQTIGDFLKSDELNDRISIKLDALQIAEAVTYRASLEMVAKTTEGVSLVNQLKKINTELGGVVNELNRLQPRRDMVKRQVTNLIGNIQFHGESSSQTPPIVFDVLPPKNAAVRQASFAKRNSSEGILELGRYFFSEVDLTTPGFEDIAKLVATGKYPEALEKYKVIFFAKMAPVVEKENVVPVEDEEEDEEDADEDSESCEKGLSQAPHGAICPPTNGQIKCAMEGLTIENITPIQKNSKSIKIAAKMGAPGAINWIFADDAPASTPPEMLYLMREFCKRQMIIGQMGSSLFSSYVLDGDKERLKKWCDIADDWAMNWQKDMDSSKQIKRDYNILIACELSNFIGKLVNAAKMRPDFIQDFPASTLARLLLAANSEYISPSIRMGRSGIYNFRIMVLNNMIPQSLKMQEFYVHQWALREACRLMELNWTHKIRRDGANAELANAGHEDTDGSLLGPFRAILSAQPRALALPPFWEQEFTENVAINARYWIHSLKQDGRAYRISTSPLADKFVNGTLKVDLLKDEPEVQKRLWKVFRVGIPQDEPTIRSESMCFSGYYMLREGWDRKDNFLYFHCINQPVCSGRDDHNGFLLNWNGTGIAVPPIYVDGRTQNTYHNLVFWPGGKADYSVSAKKDLVKQTRFHTSDSFDLAEGVYDGMYQFHKPGSKAKFYDVFGSFGYEDITKRAMGKAEREGVAFDNTPINDVQHTRQIISLHNRNIYIITDYVDSQKKHEFKQNYRLPTPLRKDNWQKRMDLMKEEKLDTVKIDGKEKMICVNNAGFPSIEMRYFGSIPLQFGVNEQFPSAVLKKANGDLGVIMKSVGTKKMPKDSPIPFSRHATVTWSGQGSQVLTSIFALKEEKYDLKSNNLLSEIKSELTTTGATGLSGNLADGTRICYFASSRPIQHHGIGVKALARVLLVVGKRGIALDCTKIEFNNKGQSPTYTDFEFYLDNGKLIIDKPIYRPIAPVQIKPESNIFVDSVQVSLACQTPEVDIRYTLDGSSPTYTSPLYTASFSVDTTCFLKTKAFRKNLDYTPWTEDGTHASVVSWTTLEKRTLLPAISPIGVTRQGLSYEYYEGPWTKIMAEGPRTPAKKSGVVSDLLDVSPKETKNPFGIRYKGYLDVPRDGVYTFYAPQEYIYIDKESGYDLRVYVDDVEWYPESRWHAHGTWSIPLAKGKHKFKVVFTDMRYHPNKVEMMWGFPNSEFVWQGNSPELMISGPGIPKQFVPSAMLSVVVQK